MWIVSHPRADINHQHLTSVIHKISFCALAWPGISSRWFLPRRSAASGEGCGEKWLRAWALGSNGPGVSLTGQTGCVVWASHTDQWENPWLWAQLFSQRSFFYTITAPQFPPDTGSSTAPFHTHLLALLVIQARHVTLWAALATAPKWGSPLESSYMNLNEPCNFCEWQFISHLSLK